jgi:integrase
MHNGRRIHRILPAGASSGDAKQAEAAIRESIGRRSVVIPGDPPMMCVMGLYLTHAESLRSPETAKKHAARCGQWMVGYRASQAPAAVAKMVQDMRKPYAAATINRTIGTITHALKLAWKQEIIPENYGARIERLPEHNARDAYWTVEQVSSIAKHASPPVKAAIWIALYTGMRRGEILALRSDDIGEASITVMAGNTKTLKTRVVPIIAPLRPWLKYLPLSVNAEGLKSGFRRARAAAGLERARFHDLRRTCATLMVQAGVDLYVVSKALGHSSVAVTQQRYAHLQIDKVREGLEKTFSANVVDRSGSSKRAPAKHRNA